MAQLLRHQFFDYSLQAFYVVSAMFDVILQVEQSTKVDFFREWNNWEPMHLLLEYKRDLYVLEAEQLQEAEQEFI